MIINSTEGDGLAYYIAAYLQTWQETTKFPISVT